MQTQQQTTRRRGRGPAPRARARRVPRTPGFGDAGAKARRRAGHHLAEDPAAAPTAASRSRASPASRRPTRCSRSPRTRRPRATWNAAQARAAVNATTKRRQLARCTRSTTSPTRASTPARPRRSSMLVARPLGLSPTRFNPDGDAPGRTCGRSIDAGHQAERLVRRVQRDAVRGDRQARARRRPGRHARVHPQPRRRPSGGWNFAGDPTGAAAAGGHRHDGAGDPGARRGTVCAGRTPTCARASRSWRTRTRPNGAWQSFGSDDPNSTALAIDRDHRRRLRPDRGRAGGTSARPGAAGTRRTRRRSPGCGPTSWRTGGSRARTTRFGVNTFATIAVDPGAAARLAPGRRPRRAAVHLAASSACDGGGSGLPVAPRRRQATSAAIPATSMTKPRIAKATDRPTGAWTSSPSRVRPVAWTRELPFALTLRAPDRAPAHVARPVRAGRARSGSRRGARAPIAAISSRITSS